MGEPKEAEYSGIKIVSDGTLLGTSVRTLDGQELEWITNIRWEMDVNSSVATATIEFTKVPVELTGEARERLEQQISAERVKIRTDALGLSSDERAHVEVTETVQISLV